MVIETFQMGFGLDSKIGNELTLWLEVSFSEAGFAVRY